MDTSEQAKRFLASTIMNFDMWHDGTGYDLAMLATVPVAELKGIEEFLLKRRPQDWRDTEALARIKELRGS
jgi:hypothetical protein